MAGTNEDNAAVSGSLEQSTAGQAEDEDLLALPDLDSTQSIPQSGMDYPTGPDDQDQSIFQLLPSYQLNSFATGSDFFATTGSATQEPIFEDPFLSEAASSLPLVSGEAALDLLPAWQPEVFPSSLAAPDPAYGEFAHQLDITGEESSWAFPQPPLIEPSSQRTLPRRRSRYLRRGQNQYQPTFSSPVDIPRPPASASADTENTLDPMQRWQESPPDDEAASLSAIADALASMPLRSARSSTRSVNSQRAISGSRSRPASLHSHGSATSYSSASNSSINPSLSRRSSYHERTNSSSRGAVAKKGKRTRKSTTVAQTQDGTQRRCFPCTFCCDTFKSKYDWSRHEKSLHLNLEGWRCTPFGATTVSPDTGQPHCAYCNILSPSSSHIAGHNHGGCHDNVGQPPVFSRKDHLTQHLRLVHHTQKPPPNLDHWKIEPPRVTSRCGFCDLRMQTWQERVDHLAGHFRRGFTMDDWKGDHDFEPAIAPSVMNSMPPYLLGCESRCPVPFSATDPGTKDHLSQIQTGLGQNIVTRQDGYVGASLDSAGVNSPASPGPQQPPASQLHQTNQPADENGEQQDARPMTFPELLVLHLGRYAREQMSLGIMPTDKMFQDEARRITYRSSDPWDQTIADNQHWLSGFRSRHLQDDSGEREGTS